MRFVVALMDDAMGLPGAGWPFVIDAAGGEAPALAHKPEGRHGSQPGKPLWGIWAQGKLALLRADHDRGAPPLHIRSEEASDAVDSPLDEDEAQPLLEGFPPSVQVLVSRDA